jgi:hypothetical protein
MLPLVIVFQKKLGYSMKKRKNKEKRKERGQMSHSEIKRDIEAQVLLKFLKFYKRAIGEIFPKELSIHHHHPFTPYNHFYFIYHLQPSTI